VDSEAVYPLAPNVQVIRGLCKNKLRMEVRVAGWLVGRLLMFMLVNALKRQESIAEPVLLPVSMPYPYGRGKAQAHTRIRDTDTATGACNRLSTCCAMAPVTTRTSSPCQEPQP
jgi:hypothetical protein